MAKQSAARKAEPAEISAPSQARARPHDTAVAGEAAAVWVDPRTLVRNPKNPRRNDAAVPGVARSIQENGFGAPIVARLANRMIIAGDTRWRAAVEVLELPLVPVRFLDVTQKQAEVLTVGDNKLGELAEWDDQKLADLLQEMEPAEQLLAGFGPDDIGDLLASMQGEAPELVEDEVPEPPKVPVTQPGDVWLIGRHRLVCGDCRNPDDVARVCDGARVNLAFTSPPYASQRKYDESSGFKPIHPDEYVAWFEAVQANVRSVLAEDGSWFVNIKEHCDDGQRSLYVKDLAVAHVRQWRWQLVDEYMWIKPGLPRDPVIFGKFKDGWESVFWFSAVARPKFRPAAVMHESDSAARCLDTTGPSLSKMQGTGASYSMESFEGMAFPSNVLKVAPKSSGERHPAAFPVGLPSFFLRAYTDEGDTALDPFMGSGTTLIAAEQLGRTCFGIELSPAYCDVVVERWQALTGGKAKRA
jgi:DNA modification methylase